VKASRTWHLEAFLNEVPHDRTAAAIEAKAFKDKPDGALSLLVRVEAEAGHGFNPLVA
jgi:hypothetical protein